MVPRQVFEFSPRLLRAVFLAPPLGGALGFPLMMSDFFGPSAMVGLIGGILFGSAMFVVFWMPVHALLMAFKLRSLPAYLGAGLIAWVILYWPATMLFKGGPLGSSPFEALPPHLLVGLFFWLIRRPDRDPPNPANPTP